MTELAGAADLCECVVGRKRCFPVRAKNPGLRHGSVSFCCLVVFLACSGAVAASDPPITAVALSRDGRFVVAGSQRGIQVSSEADPDSRWLLPVPPDHVSALTFSANGSLLLIAGGAPAESGHLRAYDWFGRRTLWEHVLHDDLITAVSISADGRHVVSASFDRSVKLIRAVDGQVVRTMSGHSKGLTCACWLSDGKQFVTGSLDQSLRVWDAETGEVIRTFNNHTSGLQSVCQRPSDSGLPMIASSANDKTVRFWQPTIGRMVRFVRLPDVAREITWSSDGQQIIAACSDGYVRLIDPETLMIRSLPARMAGRVYSITEESGLCVAGGSNGALRTFDLSP